MIIYVPKKDVVFIQRWIYRSYVYPKRTEFIASYQKTTCVYYILLDNRDLQSYQVGQSYAVAITTLAQSTFCILTKQSQDQLVAWTQCGIPLQGDSDQRRIL